MTSSTLIRVDRKHKVLITGASGLLGVAAIEKFLSAGWDVIGVSRRKPKLPSGRDIEFLSVDLRDGEAARAAFEPLTDITHIAYTALHEKAKLVAGWSSKEQIKTNNAMLRNVVEPIVRTASNFQHISILQGTKIYGVHLHPIPIPARSNGSTSRHVRPGYCGCRSLCLAFIAGFIPVHESGTAPTQLPIGAPSASTGLAQRLPSWPQMPIGGSLYFRRSFS